MAKSFADARQSVTCLVRKPAGKDAYGNRTYIDSEVVVNDCLVAPTGSNEDSNDADRLVDSATIYNLTGTWPDESAINRVRLNDGTVWEIDGAPERWDYKVGGVVVQLRRVRG